MFHRRLLLLLAVFAAALGAIGAQLGRLTLVQGAELRARAEARLESLRWVQTVRGRVLDRKGRVLAQDRPSLDVAVHFAVLTGAWAEAEAGRAARRFDRAAWAAGGREERAALVQPYREAFHAHVDRAWGVLADAARVNVDDLLARRAAVIDRVDAVTERVHRTRRVREFDALLARGREITTEIEEEVARRVGTPLRESQAPHVLLPAVSDEIGFELMRLADQRVPLVVSSAGGRVEVEVPRVPGLVVQHSADREYPYESLEVEVDRSSFPSPLRAGPARVTVPGVATHLVGWVGRGATAEDVQARRERMSADPARREASTVTVAGRAEDRGQYEDADVVGRWGVEAGREDDLRGLRGLRVEHLDTGQVVTIDAVPGRDVRLTIDLMLQARVQAAMDPALGLARVQDWHLARDQEPNAMMPPGTPINGAAVVLDVESGEILAMVSTPSFTREDARRRPELVFADPVNYPYVNRAVARPYPPGSIAKAALLPVAVTMGRHGLDEAVECTGHLYPSRPDELRCWIYKRSQALGAPTTHTIQLGRGLSARDALMVSCNIYFFTVGRRLGPDGIVHAYAMHGVGSPFELGVGPEEPGVAGAFRTDRLGNVVREGGRRVVRPPTSDQAVLMGIGQGPVAWTPLHAADAYATLARRGVRIRPRLVADAPVDRRDLGLDQRAIAAALEGLDASVNDAQGTGHHLTLGEQREPIFSLSGVRVWGKTGTADASPIVVDEDGPEGPLPRRAVRDGDHSWFVILVGPEGGRPRYAVAVLMEYAGSGGKVSGPIANQIIYALRAEGYL